MSDRERARELVGNGLHGTNVSHERRLYLQDAIAAALAQARAEGLRQAAEVAHNLRIRCDWNACSFVNEGERPHECRYPDDFKEYRYEDDIAAAIRKRAEGGE